MIEGAAFAGRVAQFVARCRALAASLYSVFFVLLLLCLPVWTRRNVEYVCVYLRGPVWTTVRAGRIDRGSGPHDPSSPGARRISRAASAAITSQLLLGSPAVLLAAVPTRVTPRWLPAVAIWSLQPDPFSPHPSLRPTQHDLPLSPPPAVTLCFLFSLPRLADHSRRAGGQASDFPDATRPCRPLQWWRRPR